eukprot:3267561-Rhodomonas_salina.1
MLYDSALYIREPPCSFPMCIPGATLHFQSRSVLGSWRTRDRSILRQQSTFCGTQRVRARLESHTLRVQQSQTSCMRTWTQTMPEILKDVAV